MTNNFNLKLLVTAIVAVASLLLIQPHLAIATFGGITEDTKFDQNTYYKLTEENYSALEIKYNNYLALYAKDKITADELQVKFSCFSKMPRIDSRFDKWVKSFPQSYAALLARGIQRVSAAWESRGDNYAKDTTDSQFKAFKELLKEAKADLDNSLKLNAKPIVSYSYLIKVAKGLNNKQEHSLLNSALEIDSTAYFPRYEYLVSITPKWGGDEKQMDKFISECKKSNMSREFKRRIESNYFCLLAESASYGKEYRAASDYYYKAYDLSNNPDDLDWAVRAAMNGNHFDFYLLLVDKLIKFHPEYSDGYNLRGWLYESHFKDYNKMTKDYLTASDLGDSYVQNRIGWFYMTGTYVPTDLKKAKLHLTRAAKQNNKTAIENLAILENMQNRAGQIE